MKRKKWEALLAGAITLAASCTGQDTTTEETGLKGIWLLQESQNYNGDVTPYDLNERTWLRIYDDTCYYACQITAAPNGMLVDPQEVETYTYLEKEGNRALYLQGNNTQPLTVVDDSTIVIQEYGIKFTWRRSREIGETRSQEIMDVIKRDIEGEELSAHRYVFSKAEKVLKTTNQTLISILIAIAGILIAIISYAHNLRKNQKRIEEELRLIEQEREARPQPIRLAMSSVEKSFLQSDFYQSLRKRIEKRERLKTGDWDMIEDHFKSVYPRFCSTLRSLYSMSPLEYQVCLLLKLKASPSEIADILCKDVSSISSIRSRLYQKVFGKKGGSKDWDEFIRSL